MTDRITCSFIFKNGKRCNNKAIFTYNGISTCHIKGHCCNSSKFEEYTNRLYQEFKDSTLSIDTEQIINNKKDGACFYRAISKYMFNNFDKFNIDVDEYDEDINAFNIQKDLNNFILENRNMLIRQCSQTLEDIVLSTHCDNISTLEEYYELYNIFAGDNDYVLKEVKSKTGRIKKVKESIPDRWGSTAEQIAFSMKYGIKVNVYLLQKFDNRTLKVKEVTKRSKGDIRIRLYQSIDPSLEDIDSNGDELNIILEKQSSMPHYLYILS